MSAVRILVADDHELVRSRLCSLLRSRPEFEVVCEASDGLQAVEKAQAFQPAVVVLDISMPVMNGIQAVPKIRQVAPDAQILFVSQHNSLSVVREALATGARGYIVKSDASADLVAAVLAVSQGMEFVSRKIVGGSSNSPTSASFTSASF